MIITSLIWLEVSGAFLSMVQMRERCHAASLSLICDRLLLLLQGKVSGIFQHKYFTLFAQVSRADYWNSLLISFNRKLIVGLLQLYLDFMQLPYNTTHHCRFAFLYFVLEFNHDSVNVNICSF